MNESDQKKEPPDRSDIILKRIKNNRAIAVLIVLGIILMCILTFTNNVLDQWSKLKAHFHHPTRASTPPTANAEKRLVYVYRPADSRLPLAVDMQTIVWRSESSDHDHFVVQFVIPQGSPVNGEAVPKDGYSTIGITVERLVNNSWSYEPSAEQSRHGHWKVGDTVTLEFDLPKIYSDPAQGWSVRICIVLPTKTEACIPSPNLLLGAPLTDHDAPPSIVTHGDNSPVIIGSDNAVNAPNAQPKQK